MKGRDLAFSCYEREARDESWESAAKIGNYPLDTFQALAIFGHGCKSGPT